MQPAQERIPDLVPKGPRVQLLSGQILMWLPVTGSIADHTNATFDSGGTFIGDAIRTPKRKRVWPALSSRMSGCLGCLQELPVLGLSSACAYHCARC